MRRILVGYDGSEVAGHAVDRASELALRCDCPLMVLTAADRLVHEHGLTAPAVDEELARKTAAQGAERARKQGVRNVEARISLEAPDDALVLVAQEGYDLLVVGHRGRGVLRELLIGSTAKSVVDRAPCSVLVVR
jgi:nucleotide-binding universal stress UspA family protein